MKHNGRKSTQESQSLDLHLPIDLDWTRTAHRYSVAVPLKFFKCGGKEKCKHMQR